VDLFSLLTLDGKNSSAIEDSQFLAFENMSNLHCFSFSNNGAEKEIVIHCETQWQMDLGIFAEIRMENSKS
jgi:hypothetical protein